MDDLKPCNCPYRAHYNAAANTFETQDHTPECSVWLTPTNTGVKQMDDANTAGLVERLTDEADLCRNDGADDIAELLTEAAATLTAQAAEIARLKEALNKANLPEWFYHPDYTESVLFSPDEVIDEVYDFKPGWHIAEIDCAKPLPTIWCAVHVRTCDEMDALETDDRFVFTEHASREAAEAALTGSQSHE